MRAILIILVAIAVGGFAGSWIKNLPGFVVIVIDKTSYEMRLWIAVSIILLIIFLVYLLIKLIRPLFKSARRVRAWRGGRHWRNARKKTIEGMLALSEGRWKASEEAMISAVKNSDTKLINYLIAAQAAQQQGAEVRRDAYLRQAFQAEPAAKVAIGLTQAQLQLQHQQFEHALASLTELRNANPNHPYVLKLLSQLFTQLQDWQSLLDLLPNLKKQQVLTAEELQLMEIQAVSGFLFKRAQNGEIEALNDSWLKLPNSYRKNPQNILAYVTLLIDFEQMDEADHLMRPVIKKHCNSQVLTIYGNIISSAPANQVSFLENWFQANENAPAEVFLSIGKLAFYAKLWGKARHFLERALRVAPGAEAYLFMAKTLQQLDDDDHAANCYQQGLEFVTQPRHTIEQLSLPQGSEDLVSADLLPKFQKLEN